MGDKDYANFVKKNDRPITVDGLKYGFEDYIKEDGTCIALTVFHS